MEIPRGRGFQKPRDKGGIQYKKPSMGGVWIFSGTTHCNSKSYIFLYHKQCLQESVFVYLGTWALDCQLKEST